MGMLILFIINVPLSLSAQLQGAGSADAGGHHGNAHLQRAGLCQREGRGGHPVHLHATGKLSLYPTVQYLQ